MTESEQVISVPSQFEWTKAGAELAQPPRAATFKAAIAGGVLPVLLLLGGGTWVYWHPAQLNDFLARAIPGAGSQSDLELLVHLSRWQLVIMIAAAGAIVIGLTIVSFRSRKGEIAKTIAQREVAWNRREAAWKSEARVIRAELATRTRAELDVRIERDNLGAQIAELSRANATLTDELNRRQNAERTLSRQQSELVRSKDVLQLHVQARTQQLENLQRRSALILNSAGEGICGLDLAGRITFANPAAARILGLAVEEMAGLPENEVFAGFQASAAGVQPTEIVATRRDHSTFVAEFLRSPLTENERTIGEVVLFKDITARKQAEEALTQKAAELARSNSELEQFAFVASHDLQEPLRKIQAFGDRLKAKCDEAKLEAGRDYLERMQNAAGRMRRLIDDLLTFSRVVSRTEPFASVNLSTVAREVLGDLEVRIEKSGAKVELGELPTVEADAVQMRQLLQNLIGNALKFQPPGAKPVVAIRGRILSAAGVNGQAAVLSRKPVEAGGAVEDQFCELVVQDNGIGFEEKYLDKIFAVFQRLHGRQEYEGTGIGLAVCRRIADRHGGKITAQSRPGEGATFVVLMPVRQKQPLQPLPRIA
jgi:PAS domain S-box-containing protein